MARHQLTLSLTLAGGERHGLRWQVRSQGRSIHGRQQCRGLGQEVEGLETTQAASAAAQTQAAGQGGGKMELAELREDRNLVDLLT